MFRNGYQAFHIEKASMNQMTSPTSEIYEKLYDKSLNFNLQNGSSFSRNILKLCVSIERQPSSSGMHSKELLVNLTNPEDPFFLYTLVLTSDDFLNLKQQQGLLVDYTAFPQSLISLLELCLGEENKTEPRYLLCLNTQESGTAQLDVVETSQFKLLTHLSLKLTPPPDTMIKQYLSSCYKSMKEMNNKLENKVIFLEKELQKRETQFKENSCDQESRQKVVEAEKTALIKQHEEQLEKERITHQTALENECSKFKKEIEELKDNFSMEKKAHDEKLNILISGNKSYESQLKQLRDELKKKSANDENSEQLREITARNVKLKAELRSATEELADMEDKYRDLKESLKSQEAAVRDARQEVNSLQLEKNSLQACLHRSRQVVQEKETENANLTQDLTKAHEIIRKMQREARAFHETLKNRESLIKQYESFLRENKNILKKLEQENCSLKHTLQDKIEEIRSFSDTIHTLKSRLNMTEKSLQEKELELEFLTRKIQAEQLVNTYNKEPTDSVNRSSTAEDRNIQNCSEPVRVIPPPNKSKNPPEANIPRKDALRQSEMSLDPRYLERHPRKLGI